MCYPNSWSDGVWRSPVARTVRVREVGGSNPLTPTTQGRRTDAVPVFIDRAGRMAAMGHSKRRGASVGNRMFRLPVLLIAIALFLSTDASVQPQSAASAPVASDEDYRTEQLLRRTALPPRDLYTLVPRLRGMQAENLRRTAGNTEGWAVGTTERFWVGNLETNEYTRRPATLRHVSREAYWWIEDGRAYDQAALEQAATRFDATAARNREVFGTEWRPGVDDDPRVVVLVASTPGAGGYYSSADEYPREINQYSNQHEMIYIDATPGDDRFDATMAHEFQHMIHWNEHASQAVWLNEGMAEYAEEVNGFGTGLEAAFAAQPDTQLNTWSDQPSASIEHYGQSFRFMSYLAARFGPQMMADLIRAEGTGLDAVEQALKKRADAPSFSRVYADWLAANVLARQGDGDLAYNRRMTPVATTPAPLTYRTTTNVRQWGADYYARQANEAFTLRFRGTPRVPLVSNTPNSGKFQWYSNRGDLIDSTLTRELDLRSARAATLELDLWYDIETDYDYAYVAISDNAGDTWQTLKGDRTTNSNPNGNNLGNGLTGASGGWVTERFDIAAYAGKQVLLRIEYVTDDGYNAQGIVVDGVRIPEIGLSDDSETVNGWRAEGWVRSNNYVPGRYRLLVLDPDNAGTYVEIPVGADGQAYATFERGAGNAPVVIVGGAASTTTQDSEYTLQIEPPGPGSLGLLGGRADASR